MLKSITVDQHVELEDIYWFQNLQRLCYGVVELGLTALTPSYHKITERVYEIPETLEKQKATKYVFLEKL